MKKRILAISTLTKNAQITIKKIIRNKLDVKVGDIIVFFEENGIIVVEKG
ncbi:unnamed protein product [marine sediment metagenome]|uniref:SpoVT-AbrB domain-containing protein n=1 Tax=marine sediment metagenome TaxID=412755 RepID=X1HZD3_9ZZZZ